MQCGPIRHTATKRANAPHDLEVIPRSRFARIDLPTAAGIQDVFRHLANDVARTQAFVLHGRMSKKQRATLITALDALPPEAPRILLATGKLVGEGFDHPPLDTLVLAMPVSWKGTLQQYAGRLHREDASKTDVRIIDFVDTGHPALLRMWDKRRDSHCSIGRQARRPRHFNPSEADRQSIAAEMRWRRRHRGEFSATSLCGN